MCDTNFICHSVCLDVRDKTQDASNKNSIDCRVRLINCLVIFVTKYYLLLRIDDSMLFVTLVSSQAKGLIRMFLPIKWGNHFPLSWRSLAWQFYWCTGLVLIWYWDRRCWSSLNLCFKSERITIRVWLQYRQLRLFMSLVLSRIPFLRLEWGLCWWLLFMSDPSWCRCSFSNHSLYRKGFNERIDKPNQVPKQDKT